MTFYVAFHMNSSESFFDQSPFMRRVEGPLGVVCHERREGHLRRATVREMKEGPSSSVIRSRSQATAALPVTLQQRNYLRRDRPSRLVPIADIRRTSTNHLVQTS